MTIDTAPPPPSDGATRAEKVRARQAELAIQRRLVEHRLEAARESGDVEQFDELGEQLDQFDVRLRRAAESLRLALRFDAEDEFAREAAELEGEHEAYTLRFKAHGEMLIEFARQARELSDAYKTFWSMWFDWNRKVVELHQRADRSYDPIDFVRVMGVSPQFLTTFSKFAESLVNLDYFFTNRDEAAKRQTVSLDSTHLRTTLNGEEPDEPWPRVRDARRPASPMPLGRRGDIRW